MSNLPPCPQCSSPYAYEDREHLVCPECGHEWNPGDPGAKPQDDQRVVTDANGNPLDVSAVVTFYFENPIRAALAVENAMTFVRSQAQIVMKQVVSQYPYEERAGQKHEHSLKSESAAVSREAVAGRRGRPAVLERHRKIPVGRLATAAAISPDGSIKWWMPFCFISVYQS